MHTESSLLHLHRESPNQTEATGEETEDIEKVIETDSNLQAAAAANSGSDSPPLTHNTSTRDSAVSILLGGPPSTAGDCNIAPYIKTNAKTITRALLRSSRIRRKVTVEELFSPDKNETESKHKDPQSDKFSGEEVLGTNKDTSLLGYDAQWCWVESQDDVTFL